jgi:hypothetical protein
MANFFQVRMKTVKLSFSPFSTDSMLSIGQSTLNHIVQRIQGVQDITDSQARPLKEKYAEEKKAGRYVSLGGYQKYRGLPRRDWTLRGRTLQACKVKFASQDRVTIGPTSKEAGMIMTARNKLDHMWGMAPSDTDAMVAAAVKILREGAPVKVQKTGELKIA